MKTIHAIVLASAALLAMSGAAMAQTVSDGDAYQQGYAAGAAAQKGNSFDTYSQAYDAGKEAEQGKLAADQQAFNDGYLAGMAQADKTAQNQAVQQDTQLAYNQGYQDRAQQDQDKADRAFDYGYNAARNDDDRIP